MSQPHDPHQPPHDPNQPPHDPNQPLREPGQPHIPDQAGHPPNQPPGYAPNQPGYPPADGAYGPAQATGSYAQDQQPPKKKSNLPLQILGALVLIGLLIGAAMFLGQNAPAQAKVGDCVAQTGENDVEIVKCDDPKAAYTVLGRVDDKLQSEMEGSCDAFPDATNTFWEGKQGQKGYVLCLQKK